jgi:tetratricopeptide (TPR) repeat protein
MANRQKKTGRQELWSEWSTPVLILAAFLLGAGGMWTIMRTSSSPGASAKAPIPTFVPAPATQPPDVSQLAPADAARALADWNYDRKNWSHAIDHYQEAIARGADNPDVRTDLGNCYRFLGQAKQALAQYELAQKQNPQHENSLFNQAGLYAELLHDDQKALAVAREFVARFPQSSKAEPTRQLIQQLQDKSRTGP